jgi:ProP effector
MTSPTPAPRKSRSPLLAQLAAEFVVFAEAKPLALGIHKALIEAQPGLAKTALRTALHTHTHSTRYLKGLVAGAPRYNLAGAVEGEVNAEQAALALATLKERMRKIKERQKAESEAQLRQAKLEQLAEKFGRR